MYFVIASCGLMPRDNRELCFYVCCSNCVGFCENVCWLAAVVKDSGFSLGVLKYVCVKDVMDVVYT